MMKSFILILTISFIGVIETQTEPISIKTKQYEGVIFPSNFDMLLGFREDSIPGHFTPTLDLIKLIENQLENEIKVLNNPKLNQGRGLGPVIHRKLPKYYRQYIGLSTDDGDKIVEINFVWNNK